MFSVMNTFVSHYTTTYIWHNTLHSQSVASSRYEMKYRRSWITNETMKTGEKRGYYNQTQKGNGIFYIQKSVQIKQCPVSYTNQL